MKNARTTADQIRPILEAMERSIESARRRRLHHAETPPPPPRPTGRLEPSDTTDPPRQKARPKRGTTFAHLDGTTYRRPLN